MKNIFKYYFVIATLFTIGCSKAQKNKIQPNQVIVTKLKTQIPVKISFYENNDSIAALFIPQEFKLKNNDNLTISFDVFQVRSFNILEKISSSILEIGNELKIGKTPDEDNILANQEKKYRFYIGTIIPITEDEKKILLKISIPTNEFRNNRVIYELGNISDNKEFLEKKIGLNRFIYITTFNEETMMVPDLEIPITFE